MATSAQGNRYVLDADTRLRSWGSGGALRIFKTVVLWAPRLERGHGAREEAAEAPRGPNLSLSQQKENHALRTQMLGSGRGSRAGPLGSSKLWHSGPPDAAVAVVVVVAVVAVVAIAVVAVGVGVAVAAVAV